MSNDAKPSPSAPKSRSERRREDTRRRLMKATYELIAKRGLEGLVIQDITEAADVGYGSFYNHFSSKEAIVDAVTEAVLARGVGLYERIAAQAADEVETFAMELRACLEISQSDPTWGWFVIRTMLSGQRIRRAIADRLQRNVEGGIKSGVFTAHDAEMARHTVGGLLLLGTLKIVSGEVGEDYPARLVETMLHTLGVPASRAKAALARPLPDMPTTPFTEAA